MCFRTLSPFLFSHQSASLVREAEYGGDMASDVALQFQYQDEVVANEIRVAEYDCALRRRDSGFDCTVADEQCPEF